MDKLSTILLTSLNPRQQIAFKKILKEACENQFLSPDEDQQVLKKTCVVILYGNTDDPVGFYTPKSQTWGEQRWWRAGTMFLALRYRGKGIMKAVLEEYFSHHPRNLAWIEDKNKDSIKLFTSMGFTKDEPKEYAERPGHWFIRVNQLAQESEPMSIRW